MFIGGCIMDLNVMMKYKRRRDCWLCPVCECENPADVDKCYLCGSVRTGKEVFLNAWSEEDERRERASKMREDLRVQPTQIPNPMPGPIPGPAPRPAPIPTPIPSGKVFVDEEPGEMVYPPNKKGGKIAAIIIIAVVILALVAGIFWYVSHSREKTYNSAIDYYYSQQYQEALDKFNKLPADYKDVAEMKNDTKYQLANQHLANGDVESARNLFTELGDYSDSEEMLKECEYREAEIMLGNGQYEEAKAKFEALAGYSDSDDMIKECDYQRAMAYYSNDEYVEAMCIFNSLGYYSDSSNMFSNAEYWLINENSSSYRYTDEYDMEGYWTDYNGNYVNYTKNGTNMHVNYDFPHTSGTYFKVENGVHYHGNDYNWKKQWIFEYVSYDTVLVYNYKDGKVYTFTKSY